jgi:hypothetical protein
LLWKFFSYCLEGDWNLISIQLLKETCQIAHEWQNSPFVGIGLLFEDNSSIESGFYFNFPKRVPSKGLYLYVSKHLKNNLSINSFILSLDGQKIEGNNLHFLYNSKSIQFDLINESFIQQTQYYFSFVLILLSKYVRFLDKEDIFTPFLFDIFSCFQTFPNEKKLCWVKHFICQSYLEGKPFTFLYYLRSFSFFINDIPREISNRILNEVSFDQIFSFSLIYQNSMFPDIQRFVIFILIIENIFQSIC